MWLWAPVFFPGWERPSAIHSSVKHNFLYVSNSLNCSWPCSLAQVRGSMCLKAEVPHPALRKLLSQSTASLGTVLCSCTFLHRVSSRGKRDHSSCLGLERMAAFFSFNNSMGKRVVFHPFIWRVRGRCYGSELSEDSLELTLDISVE